MIRKRKNIFIVLIIVALTVITSAVVMGYGGTAPSPGDELRLTSHPDISHRNQSGQGLTDFIYEGTIFTEGDVQNQRLDYLTSRDVHNFSRSMFRESALRVWVDRLNGNLDFVRREDPEVYRFVNETKGNFIEMYYIREIAWLSGGNAEHRSGFVNIRVTPNPEIHTFTYSGTPRPNNQLNIRMGSRAYAVGRPHVDYEITVNGQPFESGRYNTVDIWRNFTWTPTEPGTYTFRAVATDEVDRDSEPVTLVIEVAEDAPVVEPEPTPEPPPDLGEPPTVILNGPTEIKAGNTFCLYADARSPDGTIDHYSWNLSANGSISGSSGCGLYWMKEGTYPVSVTVTDDRGQTATDSINIRVIPPTPVASFTVGGTLKENRLVTVNDNSSSPTYYPIDWSQSYYEISAVNAANEEAIRYRGSLNSQRNLETLYKLQGQYQIKLFVKNTAGLTDETTQTLTIAPDEKPIANYSMITEVYRDPQNNNQATIHVKDMSRSDDNDLIQQRIWRYRYDSNNDGNFTDENWVVIDEGNNTNISFEVSEVGYYQVQLEVIESFGQPTIPEFINESDYRRNNTDNKPKDETIVKVENRAPSVDWGP